MADKPFLTRFRAIYPLLSPFRLPFRPLRRLSPPKMKNYYKILLRNNIFGKNAQNLRKKPADLGIKFKKNPFI